MKFKSIALFCIILAVLSVSTLAIVEGEPPVFGGKLLVTQKEMPKDPYTLSPYTFRNGDFQIFRGTDTLNLFIMYSRCSENRPNLVWDGTILKSSPPQVKVYISYDSGDMCETYETYNYSRYSGYFNFDLSPIRVAVEDTTSKVVVLFEEYNGTLHMLEYNFNLSCGNGICEGGEDDYCPPCVYQEPACMMPCRVGTCPQDCETIACTKEAKICPDGTGVYRTGPDCEFAPCPGENTCTINSDCYPPNYSPPECGTIPVCIEGKCGLDSEECPLMECDINLCKPFLCCKGENCPLGFPQQCASCPEICAEPIVECTSGCVLDDKCLPYGTRVEGRFCGLDSNMKGQSEEGAQCDNSYECSSNVCANSKCISGNLTERILNWFKKLFGK